MECVPAIDLHEGRAVRLVQGDFAQATSYGDPVELAASYVEGGARRLHVVDLDAARAGAPVHQTVVADLVESLPVPIQFGGGVRTLTTIESLLGLGVDRVILGTAAIEDDRFARDAGVRFEQHVLIGLDYRADDSSGTYALAVRGWENSAGVDLSQMLERLADVPVGGVVLTSIGRDGTLGGPDIAGLRFTLERTALDVYASGGVARADDLEHLALLEVDGRRLSGVIVGKALVSGVLSMKEAIAACER